MRDPNRISTFCEEFGEMWEKNCPDFRFGQLVSVLLGEVYSRCRHDPFFIEDDEMKDYLQEVFKTLK